MISVKYIILLTLISAAAMAKNPNIIGGLNVFPAEGGVKVTAGKCAINGKVVTVPEDVVLPVKVGSRAVVCNEEVKVPVTKPNIFVAGYRIKGPYGGDINALGSYNPGSMVLRKSPYGKPLIEGKDFVMEENYAMLCLTEDSSASPDETLYASYSYKLVRIDSVFVTADGKVVLKEGKPEVTLANVPECPPGTLRVANIFRPYNCGKVTADDILLPSETAAEAKTRSKKGLIPRTMAKIKSGEPVKIVCWGDSVTVGYCATAPEKRYVDLFTSMLNEKYPKANIEVINESYSGSTTAQWVFPDEFPKETCDFEKRVISHKPDLVTMEFVNDSGMSMDTVKRTYNRILERFREEGIEWIIITPHFIIPGWMGADKYQCEEPRGFVHYARKLAAENNVAVADAAERWNHLKYEGIPFYTYLTNGINHPDDRGHRLFAEEMIKCFD